MHNRRVAVYGMDNMDGLEEMMKHCEICGSTNRVAGKSGKFKMDLCSRHRQQMDNHGKILERTRFDSNEFVVNGDVLEITMYNKEGLCIGKAIADIGDFDKLKAHKWNIDRLGYISSTFNRKTIKMHRLITNAPEGMHVDHINHNPSDNRSANLRVCTRQENMMNRSVNSNNTSGYKGVTWHKKMKQWTAQISINGKQRYIGAFNIKEDAIAARNDFEIKYFGEFMYQEAK